MIRHVVIAPGAQKDLRQLPRRIAEKLYAWVDGVERVGLEEMRKIPSYHDEMLKGKRKGQRSIRLSLHYRAMYEIRDDGSIAFVSIREVNKHEY